MGSQLHQLLKSLCFSMGWKYAVFWKLKHCARMMLTWEDAYYDSTEYPQKKWFNNNASNLHDGHRSHDLLGLAVAKMSYHVYSLGEGIVGQVAVTGKHRWISAEKHASDPGLLSECEGWQAQFSAGIKTIAVVAVIPQGVVQLGSLDKMVEDVNMINLIRESFFGFQDPLAGLMPGIIQTSTENSCLSEISPRTSGSEVYQDTVSNINRSFNHCRKNLSSPTWHSFGNSGPNFDMLSSSPKKTDEVISKNQDQGPEKSIQGSFKRENLLPPSCNGFIMELHEIPRIQELRNSNCQEDHSPFGALEQNSLNNEDFCFKNNGSIKSSLDDGTVPENYSGIDIFQVPTEFISTDPCSSKEGNLCSPGFSDVQLNDSLIKSSKFQSKSYPASAKNTRFRFSAGCELYEALGPAFQLESAPSDWQTETGETESIVELPEGMGSNNLLVGNHGTEHLLEAVVANIKNNGDEANIAKSFSRSVESHLTTENASGPCLSDLVTLSSAGYSFDRDTMSNFNSSGSCSVQACKGFSSTSSSMASGCLERPQEQLKLSKKRARPGESSRPRPRDRQLIQDRIKELRELVPSGSKCSIDSLLERTIKHMLFMQSITRNADKLNLCASSKLLDKASGAQVPSCHEQGSSWAVEVRGDVKVCPIIVENLNMNGQMLIEMLSDGCTDFLEIAEAIRSLGLTILKGVTKACGKKSCMSFVVEAQGSRSLHRMDVLWALMQLLQPNNDI